MIFLDLPTIGGSGSVEQQLAEIRSYIYKSNEQMNATLSNLTIDKIWEQTANAIGSSSDNNDETPKLLKQYQRLRDLIIKTADVVIKSDEKMEMAFNGSYLARSQFGEYFRKTKVNIDGTSVGINELYNYSTRLETGFETYKTDYECYIKRGLLDDSTTPIYGIELGVLNDTIILYDENGNPVNHNLESNKHFRTRITPDKWSFFQGDTEVAYIDANAIHFPAAEITGGSIDIGNGTFKVDSTGKMTATSGTFSGTLDAESLNTYSSIKNAWNKNSNNKIKLSSTDLSFYDGNEIDFNMNSKAITFYKRDTARLVDEPMARIRREAYGTRRGLCIYLEEGYGDFFRLYSGTRESKNYGFTYIPGDISLGQSDNIYARKGLYIEAPLFVKGINQGIVGSAPDTTIKIGVKEVYGAITKTNVDLYIDIINGIITDIRTTP